MYSRREAQVGKWWRQIDGLSLIITFVIISVGLVLVITASPSVAERVGLPPFYFIYRHIFYVILSSIVILIISTLDEVVIKRLCLLGFFASLILLFAVLFLGDEAKGARRWISLFGVSTQPSELLKPFYSVFIAILLSEMCNVSQKKKFLLCIAIHLIIASLILMQPDFGMAMTISLVTAGQFFVAGLSLVLLISSAILLCLMATGAYLFLPHVRKRIESFLSDDIGTNYQIGKSLESYIQGGFLGKGPGEGTVKLVLPDAHTDFIFAVVGEEFGSFSCFLVLALFAILVLHGIMRLTLSNNLFRIYSATGILMYFAIQSIFNIGVTLHLFPTKGMTLPFISYGGSSMLSFAFAIGIYLGITKHHNKLYHSITTRTQHALPL